MPNNTVPMDERVARALRDESDRQLNEKSVTQYPPSRVETYLDHARAAIEAMPASVIDEGLLEALTEARDKFADQERRIRSRFENTGCEVNLRKILEAEADDLRARIAKIDTALANQRSGSNG